LVTYVSFQRKDAFCHGEQPTPEFQKKFPDRGNGKEIHELRLFVVYESAGDHALYMPVAFHSAHVLIKKTLKAIRNKAHGWTLGGLPWVER